MDASEAFKELSDVRLAMIKEESIEAFKGESDFSKYVRSPEKFIIYYESGDLIEVKK